MSKNTMTALTRGNNETKREYVEIKLGKKGQINLEVSAWNRNLNDYVEATLRLAPEEAHLLSKMLLRHANKGNQITAAETAIAVSS